MRVLPAGYLYPKAERSVGDVLRKCAHVVRQHTAQILSVQTLMASNPGGRLRTKQIIEPTPSALQGMLPEAEHILAVPSSLAVTFVSGIRVDTVGHRRFSGARQVPGADVWRASETSRGLEPDGWMVRRPHGRHHREENREASAATRREGVGQAEHNEKTVLKSCVQGMYCLLTGAF
jgi:hypothetical protein